MFPETINAIIDLMLKTCIVYLMDVMGLTFKIPASGF